MTDNTVTITQTGCYLDNHRGHYIGRDMIELAVSYGFIIGSLERYALDMYEPHGHEESFPHEAMTELADAALDWLNSGQDECDHCLGTGRGMKEGSYYTHKDNPDVKLCKLCSGTGRGPRIKFQNFPPIIPDNAMWGWNDGDFGLFTMEEAE
jgi:hypothetical protein